ncbi:MAG: hypothetical protein IJC31_07980, partial [Spirochaetaceae bacterium]|nr:hypothetical protein [Spirochaetaceae bacterium]
SAGSISLPAGPQEQEIYEAAPIAALLHIPRSQAEDILAACKEFVVAQKSTAQRLTASLQMPSHQTNPTETQGSASSTATAQLADQLFDDEYSFEEGEESLAAEEEPPYGE